MIGIDELIENSGDSTVIGYSFANNLLRLTMDFDNFNETINIAVLTNQISVNIEQDSDDVYRNCFIELKDISELLETKNDIYVPSNDFGKMMNETRLNLNLAYGLKKDNYKYIFSLVGVNRLISCVIKDENNIKYDLDKANSL